MVTAQAGQRHLLQAKSDRGAGVRSARKSRSGSVHPSRRKRISGGVVWSLWHTIVEAVANAVGVNRLIGSGRIEQMTSKRRGFFITILHRRRIRTSGQIGTVFSQTGSMMAMKSKCPISPRRGSASVAVCRFDTTSF